jgi:large subunit ribosomal protein L9
MKVILAENIPNLGQIGDTVTVAPGYARNYLFPKKLAMKATGRNLRELEHRKRLLAQKRERIRQKMLSLAEKLDRTTITMKRKVAEEEKLYGSVSLMDIWKGLGEQGFELDRKSIQLDQPIKQLGKFMVPVRVDADVTAQVRVIVEKETE